MPAHVWTRVGRWGDAVRASLQAWQSDQKAAKGEGFLTYPAHDLHMLVVRRVDGRPEQRRAAGGPRIRRLTSDSMLHALALVRFGRFDEVAASGRGRPARSPPACGTSRRGYARSAAATRAARQFLDRSGAAASSKATFRVHPARRCSERRRSSKGRSTAGGGDAAAAITAFERAVTLQDSLMIDDPEPFRSPPVTGSARRSSRPSVRGCRTRLPRGSRRHPAQRMGAGSAAAGAAGTGQADPRVDDDLRASWARADVKISASRF